MSLVRDALDHDLHADVVHLRWYMLAKPNPLRLHEKPYFPTHIRDRLKRYDKRLDLVWNRKLGRFEVWQTVAGRDRVEVITGDGRDVDVLKAGAGIEDVRHINYVPRPKPFRVLICGRDLRETDVIGRLWLRDVWRFKNPDFLESDIRETNRRQELKDEKDEFERWYYTAKETYRCATDTPWVGYGGGRRVS